MQLQATLLLLALGLAACSESSPAPAAVPATPRRVASESVEAPAEVVLVAPEAEAVAEAPLVEQAEQPDSSAPAPYEPVSAPQPSSSATASGAVAPGKRVPLARDRKGKIIGRGLRRGERPTITMGSAGGKFSTPSRGRKVRNPRGSRGGKKAKEEPVEPAAESPGAGDPRR